MYHALIVIFLSNCTRSDVWVGTRGIGDVCSAMAKCSGHYIVSGLARHVKVPPPSLHLQTKLTNR